MVAEGKLLRDRQSMPAASSIYLEEDMHILFEFLYLSSC